MATARHFFDGAMSLEGGVDGGRSPVIIPPNQNARAFNVSHRGGFASHRPPVAKIPVTFDTETTEAQFQDGFFQGVGHFYPDNRDPYLIASIGGRLFRIIIGASTAEVSRIPILGGDNNPHRQKAWFLFAAGHTIVQNGQNGAVIFNGASARRAKADEVPVGTAMAYGNGRIWVADKNTFTAGDLAYSDPILGEASVLKFTENDFLAEGGSFVAPGDVTGMSFFAGQDSATGQASLAVSTRDSIILWDAPIDRTTWKNLTHPIQRYGLMQFGALSHESICRVNGDLFFRAPDGIRSFVVGRRDFGGWGNTPQSQAVRWILDADAKHLLHRSSSILWQNRMLSTVQPQLSSKGVWHRGVAVLDFDPLSGMTEKTPPAWDGIWTGVRVLQLVDIVWRGRQRCFAFGIDSDGDIALYEFQESGIADNKAVPIPWVIETRDMTFGSPDTLKRLQALDIYLSDLIGNVYLEVQYRPEGWPCWKDWHSVHYCHSSTWCLDGSENCQTIKTPRAAAVARVSMPSPPETSDCARDIPYSRGTSFQFRIAVTGHCSIRRIRAMASAEPEPTPGMGGVSGLCPGETMECKLIECCEPDNFAYVADPV
jgi:hypothetical protein